MNDTKTDDELLCPYCPETFDIRGERYDHCLRNHREEMDTWSKDRQRADRHLRTDS